MKRPILILTAGYGEGHNSAARAVAAALDAEPDARAEIVDLFALTAPLLNRWTRRGYFSLINAAPAVWSRAYRWLDRSPQAPRLFALLRQHRRVLARLVAERKPAAICSTYPVYPWLLPAGAGDLAALPRFTVVTDAISINSLWFRAPATGWFVTDADSAAVLHAHGIPANRVSITGFPVGPAFAEAPALAPDPGDGPERRILYMINSGRAASVRLAEQLMQQAGWRLTITAGRDPALKRELERQAARAAARVKVLGWTDRIPELLMSHHLVISKAGGATTQEAINALCPMIVNQIVPGQEEGNYELLRRHHAGAFAATPEAVVATVQQAFLDDARLWRIWRANLRALARPDAARQIARRILAATARPAFAPTRVP